MKRQIDYLKYWRYNDKRKKPWRNLKRAVLNKKDQKTGLRKGILVLLLLEAVVLFLNYGDTIADHTYEFLPVRRESKGKEELLADDFWDRTTGETKEQGVSVDWKEGKVKLWQKMERVIPQIPD